MKISVISMMVTALFGLMTTAHAEMKVASVNMQELYKSYYKRFDAEKRLVEQKSAIDKDIAARQEKLKALVQELQEIKKKDDPSITDAARKRIAQEFQMKQNQAQAEEQEYKGYIQRKQLAFQEMQKREILLVLEDIQKTVEEAAAKGDYDIVIDSSAAAAPLGTRVFPFVKKSMDITPEMLKTLNASAPAGFDPAAPAIAPTAPAASAPAAGKR